MFIGLRMSRAWEATAFHLFIESLTRSNSPETQSVRRLHWPSASNFENPSGADSCDSSQEAPGRVASPDSFKLVKQALSLRVSVVNLLSANLPNKHPRTHERHEMIFHSLSHLLDAVLFVELFQMQIRSIRFCEGYHFGR